MYLNIPPDYVDKVDAMRNLATRYVVSVLGQIDEIQDYQKLLEEGGNFVFDFWHIIWSDGGVQANETNHVLVH